MRVVVIGLVVFSLAGCGPDREPSRPRPPATADTPFRLAQFEVDGVRGIAIEVKGRLYDLAQTGPGSGKLPDNLLDLVEGYSALRTEVYAAANRLNESGAAPVLRDPDLLAPLLYPANLLAAAVNYRRHGAEMGRNLDESYGLDDPYIFAKSPRSAIIASGETLRLPPGREQIDWEVELAVVIGRKTSRVPPAEALDHVFGYTVILDISDRQNRGRNNPQFDTDWFAQKSRDGFAPMGPFIVPAEFVPDPDDLDLRLLVNGEVMQEANSGQMIHDVQALIAYISTIQTLWPGDVIATGTPPGVGAGRQPPRFLKSGDVIEAEIDGISAIRTPVQ